ncbi:MAG: hypothetical protein WBB64_03320 [Anaerolineales bacterium]
MLTNSQLIRIISLFSLLVCLPFITACSNAEQDLPLERVSLSKHACISGSSFTPHLPLGVNDQIKAPALAGGTVRSGDFLISLWLICDPSLASDDPDFPEYSWQEFSEVRYLGFLSGWEYLGDPPDQEIKESLTINGEVISGHIIASHTDPERSLSRGEGHASYGPINTENQIVAQALAAGEPVDIVLTIFGSKTLAEVHLRASFEETPDGYRLLSAEILTNTGKLP